MENDTHTGGDYSVREILGEVKANVKWLVSSQETLFAKVDKVMDRHEAQVKNCAEIMNKRDARIEVIERSVLINKAKLGALIGSIVIAVKLIMDWGMSYLSKGGNP